MARAFITLDFTVILDGQFTTDINISFNTAEAWVNCTGDYILLAPAQILPDFLTIFVYYFLRILAVTLTANLTIAYNECALQCDTVN